MKPTTELRWVERKTLKEEKAMGGDYYRTYIETEKVLQQKWQRVRHLGEADEFNEYEWRDIPTEIENGTT